MKVEKILLDDFMISVAGGFRMDKFLVERRGNQST
jgi:hypothetical protein